VAELLVRAAELLAHAAGAQPPILSTETDKRPADTLLLVARAASAQAHSVAMVMVDKPRAIRHAEAPAWEAERAVASEVEGMVAAVVGMAAVAGIGNRVMFRVV
jgi:hypothetical protein